MHSTYVDVYCWDFHEKFFCGTRKAQYITATGEYRLPPETTPIPPPKFDCPNEIPVFDKENNQWSVVINNFWIPEFEDVFIQLGNSIENSYSIEIIQQPKCATILKIAHPGPKQMSIVLELTYMQEILERIKKKQEFGLARGGMFDLPTYASICYSIQDLIIRMKRVVDETFSMIWIDKKAPKGYANRPIKIEITEYQKWDSIKDKELKEIFKKIYEENKNLLDVLQDLRNAYVHHSTTSLYYNSLWDENNNLLAKAALMKHGKTERITLITVYLESLVKSFNKFTRTYLVSI